jgi:hypothetical protein
MRLEVQRLTVDDDVARPAIRETAAVHSPLTSLACEFQADVRGDLATVSISPLTRRKLQHSPFANRTTVQRVFADTFVGVADLAHGFL